MKSKIVSIIKYNVEKNIRSKWFVILNVLLLLITLVGINFSTVSDIFKKGNIKFKAHFMGHYHTDRTLFNKYYILYHDIIEIMPDGTIEMRND